MRGPANALLISVTDTTKIGMNEICLTAGGRRKGRWLVNEIRHCVVFHSFG